MSQVVETHLEDEVNEFLNEFGDELEACSYYAFEQLQAIVTENDDAKAKEMFQDFLWDSADELDACNPDAFDVIYELAQRFGMEIW